VAIVPVSGHADARNGSELMSTNTTPKWPKTTDGTTDWEAVFEDPTGGLIQLVVQAQSVDALDECTRVVIQSLFTRKGDEAEVRRSLVALDAIMTGGRESSDVIEVRAAVENLLRRIKGERIDKARTYIAQKRGKQALERRAGAFGLPKVPLIAAATAVVLIGAALVSAWLLSGPDASMQSAAVSSDAGDAGDAGNQVAKTDVPAPEVKKPAPKKAEKPGRVKSRPNKPKAKAKPAAAKPAYPQAVLLKPLYWTYKSKSNRPGYVSYQPFIVVADRRHYQTVCVNAPWVTDAIYVTLSRIHPTDRLASARELSRAGQSSAKKINGRYGKGTVGDISFVANSDHRFRSSVMRCALENS